MPAGLITGIDTQAQTVHVGRSGIRAAHEVTGALVVVVGRVLHLVLAQGCCLGWPAPAAPLHGKSAAVSAPFPGRLPAAGVTRLREK